MNPVRPSKIEAALLYQDYTPFRYIDLVERLQLVFGEHATVQLGLHEDGSFGVLLVNGARIKLSQNQEPLGQDGFQSALSSHYTQHKIKDAAQRVQAHRKNIFLTVGGDDVLLPDLEPGTLSSEMEDILASLLPEEKDASIEEFSDRVLIARLIVSQLISFNEPDLIHWCQSDQLFLPEEMKPSHNPRGMDLQIHPSLFGSGAVENGSRKIGFHAFGAEHLTGYHVIVGETAFHLPRVISAVHDFIYSLHMTRNLPQSGTVLHFKSGAAIHVDLVPANEAFPRPHLLLDILRLGEKDVADKIPSHSKGSTPPLSRLRHAPPVPSQPPAREESFRDTLEATDFRQKSDAEPVRPPPQARVRSGSFLGPLVKKAGTIIGAVLLYFALMSFSEILGMGEVSNLMDTGGPTSLVSK